MMEKQNQLFSTANMIKMALMGVVAVLLMQFGKITLPSFFPVFLEIDFSEVPAVVGVLTIHPMAGFVIVVLKNILKCMLFGSNTAYAGEIANMLVSLGYIFPLSLFVKKGRSIKKVTLGISLGVLGMMIAGAFVNYFIAIPMYAKLFMPMDAIINMGHTINSAITDKFTLVMWSIIPFNFVKGIIVAMISVVIVKAIEPVIHYLGYKTV